ncbi:hypothetical protein BVRB_6g128300 [Beta vulgaris subsp. vulgaris]|uniref:uncharacterized protein LOC104894965 n=1 Tax=Beta vulgaris subsp. vulgaris TaxID=3555 RepID=UPI00053F4A43|nr:uncharacterized protein LOC104894965 [Beta vulgaris subsp. vulgaris]KMT09856.1 hypothetical protein BVRB_6g128300 [Beta vulgaris subsp. vulgaris]
MGNCQAAEAVAVVQHPGNGKIERMYWSISANEVMCSNPGHYVALVVVESSNPSSPVKHQLKLLKPTDTLHVGQVYRLISFEDVIKEFAGKKSLKLGKLLKESGVLKSDARRSKLDHKQIEQAAPGGWDHE